MFAEKSNSRVESMNRTGTGVDEKEDGLLAKRPGPEQISIY